MASTGEVWKLGHRPALDGVRGIAVLLVVAAHAEVPGFAGGGIVGVTMFFTLSGFLITTLLLEERADRGRVSVTAFYQRRALRLLPALGVVTAATVGMGLATGQDAVLALLYVGNWFRAGGVELGGLSHTWSLAIEEQFYLIWPAVLLLWLARGSRRALLILTVAGAAVAVVLRLAMWDAGAGLERVYFGGDTRADAILVGCALALFLHGRHSPRSRPALALVLLAAAVGLSVSHHGAFAYLWVPTIVAACTAAVIYLSVSEGGARWLAARWLVLVGQRSYGLYLWHFPLVVYARAWFDDSRTVTAALVALSWLLAVLTWHGIERPFLRYKRSRALDLGNDEVRPVAEVAVVDRPRG